MYEVFDLQLAGEEIANMGIYIHSLFCSFYLQLRSTYQRDDDLPNMIIERNQLPSQVTPIFFWSLSVVCRLILTKHSWKQDHPGGYSPIATNIQPFGGSA
jgi:hypothetical protein